MNTKTLNEIRYLNAKRKYNRHLRGIRVLREQRWEPSAGLAYDIFVKPFENVFSALKLTAMDLSNSMRMAWGTLFNYSDAEKLKEIYGKFEDRQSRIRTKWDPIVKSSLETIKEADPMFALALSPGYYMATSSLAAGLKAGKTTAEIVAAEDWDALLTQLRKVPDEKWGLGKLIKQQEEQAKETSELRKQLSRLFGESLRPRAGLLREQEVPNTELPSEPRDYVESLLKDTGLDEEFDSIASASALIRIDLSRELEQILKKTHTTAKLISARSADEFSKEVENAISAGSLDQSDAKGLESIMPQIEKQAQGLAKSEEFRNTMAENQGIELDELSDEVIKDTASKVAFNSAKTQFDGKAMAEIDKMMKKVEETYEKAQIDDATLKLMSQRRDISEVATLLDVYESTKRLYDETQGIVRKVKGGG